jgi:hypothetical protein
MTNGLAQALNGNFTSLTRTGFVLDETTKNLIQNGTEAERAAALVAVLNSTYKDFNKNLRDTPMGQFQVLANSAEQAKTIIGTDLLAAMQMISGPEGIGGAATAMEDFATQIGNVIYAIGILGSKIRAIPGIGKDLADVLNPLGEFTLLGQIGRFGARRKATKAGTPAQSPGQRLAIDKANRDAIKLQKQQNDLKKIDNANTTRKLVLTGDELALKELEKKFDIERIGLYAALNDSADGETKMRLLSLIAIHDQNTAMAGMIKKANEAENAFAAFIEALRATIRGMLDSIAPQVKQLQTLTGPNTPIDVQREVIRNKLDLTMPDISALQSRLSQFSNVSGPGGVTVNINAAGSITTDRDLVSMVTNAIYNNQASGIPINYSTSYV